jgi:hypothetical protein
MQSVKLEGKRGRRVIVFFSDVMRGKFILLEAKKIFLSIANPSSRSVLLMPLHSCPDIRLKLRFLALRRM